MNLRRLGESGFIERTKKIFGRFPGVISGIGEDAAVLPYSKKEYLLFTTDAVREGTHFALGEKGFYSKKATPFQIGWKALAVNLSDIAAMGGKPLYALVALGAPTHLPVSFYDELTKGIKAAAKAFGVAVVGGDTDRTRKLSVTVALIGTVEKERCIFRRGAKVGDCIFVTGTLGGSRKGKHLSFIPRVKEARRLTKDFRLNAMIDLSDGLAKDLTHICEESQVGARVDGEAIPISKGSNLRSALNDGEDFELLFTLSPRDAGSLLQRKNLLGLQVSRIGKIVEKSKGFRLQTAKGTIPLRGGFKHF
ncbi:MAG: thiamine-monophosphate kinase [Candidatus Omnitrophica bacterium]|nr:thiamine-monophosphate kinase [Candidatus Omnitrophota bacterium]